MNIRRDNGAKPTSLATGRFIGLLIRRNPVLFLLTVLSSIVAFTFAMHADGLVRRNFFHSLTHEAAFNWSPETWALLIVGAVILRSLVWTLTILVSAIWGFKCKALMRLNLFAHVLQHPGAQMLPGSAGEAVSRFRGDVDEAGGFTVFLIRLVAQFLFGIIAFWVMAQINTLVALWIFLPMAVIVVIAFMAQAYVQRLREATRGAAGSITDFLGETFSAVQAVKVAGAERPVLKRFGRINRERQQKAVRERLFGQVLEAPLSGTYATGFILLLVGESLQAGTFTVGDLSLFVFYAGSVSYAMGSIGTFLVRSRQLGVSLARMGRLLCGIPSEALLKDTATPIRGSLSVPPYIKKDASHRLETLRTAGLTYRFPNGDRGIDDINLTLRRGTFTVLTGRIGAGKTTLLRALLGLLPPQKGEVYWNEKLIREPVAFFRPPRLAYTAQLPALFSETVKDNILLGLPDGEGLNPAVQAAVLEQDINRLEDGLDTVIGPRGVMLSGGQRQRLAAARTFVRDPELFIFDDVSSALDLDTEYRFWSRFVQRQSRSCLAVSNRRSALDRADHVIVLVNGTVGDEGTLGELLKRNEEIQQIYQ